MSELEKEFMNAMRSFSWKTIQDEDGLTKAHDAVFAYVDELKKERSESDQRYMALEETCQRLQEELSALKANTRPAPEVIAKGFMELLAGELMPIFYETKEEIEDGGSNYEIVPVVISRARG